MREAHEPDAIGIHLLSEEGALEILESRVGVFGALIGWRAHIVVPRRTVGGGVLVLELNEVARFEAIHEKRYPSLLQKDVRPILKVLLHHAGVDIVIVPETTGTVQHDHRGAGLLGLGDE